jgi:hypothetical protein
MKKKRKVDQIISPPLEADPIQAIEKEAEVPPRDQDHRNKRDPDQIRRKNLATVAAIAPAATKKLE